MDPTRRQFLVRSSAIVSGVALSRSSNAEALPDRDAVPRPTPDQLAWQDAELTMFLHFGMDTFTNREWGEGTEDPKLFNPSSLDARQWVQVAKEAGFKYLILTAKHHDGFCLWPSQFTKHSVASSPWKDGKGDVVREFTQACREAKLKAGLYLSPWDRHEPTYGDSPAYNRHYVDQLTELMTNYGEIAEVWFDGANGEGPNGKKQEYDWPAVYGAIRKLQPHALIAICGPDIRWVGNEEGVARETEWSVQPAPPGSLSAVNGQAWYPAECDTSIRPGWFWHRSEDDKVKPLSQFLDIYYKSVGRNSVLLLNVPPNDTGLISDPDIARLREFRAAIDRTFGHDFARGCRAHAKTSATGHVPGCATDGKPTTSWIPGSPDLPVSLEVDLGSSSTFDVAMTCEFIADGQRVEEYLIEAFDGSHWREVARGTTVGHKKLDRLTQVTASRVRWTVLRSRGEPQIREIGLFKAAA